MILDIRVLDAGPIAPKPCDVTLPQSPVERIVCAEMRRITPLFRMGLLTPIDVYYSMLTVANFAQAVKDE